MTVYINPTAASNGSGASLVDPMNAWPTTGWAAGETYLQLGGTTYTGSIAPNTSGNSGARIYVGTCDSSGAVVTDGSNKAVIAAGANQDALDIGRNGSRNYFDILGLDLRGGTGTSRSGIYGLGGVETTTRNNTIRLCTITAQAGSGIQARGDGWTVENNTVSNCQIDGIIALGMNLRIASNVIIDNDTGLSTGDGIQVSTAASVGVCQIVRNVIRHTTASPKQGIIVAGASGSMLIEKNTVYGGGQSAIAVQIPGGIVRGNRITGCVNGISILSSGVSVQANLVVGGESGVIFTVDAATGALIYGNDSVDLTANGIYNTVAADLATWTAKNNLFYNVFRGIYAVSSAVTVNSHNAFWLCGSDVAGDATSSGGDVTDDPLLSDTYRPTATSPLIGAGTHIAYTSDLDGVQRWNPPSIGAFEYIRPRSAATRTAASTRAAASARTDR